MNAEFIQVLESMEREKGVKREILIQAVETALVSAAKRVLKTKEAEVDVKIDPKTGDISVTSDGEIIRSREFGRIAAQTAKQVIIQKIREAEKDVIYDDFHDKVNTIINGMVYRYEKGAAILDVGKTEAVLPRTEQSPRDRFRQGDRIRVFVLEVSKSVKGPQIVVSRNHSGLVRKLFELEVPEVLESIVEIKAVSREPGDRAKIAVWSKDEKVDCVGACVGMRGSRVKSIVKELQGEKIDIVRWSENIVEYVQAALSPAQCAQIQVTNPEEKKIDVLVDDDQLSLAIGRNGQNVRLASKLTGWAINIKSKKEAAAAILDGEDATDGFDRIAKSLKLSSKVVETLKKARYDNIKKLKEISLTDLKKLEGIGEKTAQKIFDKAQCRTLEEKDDGDKKSQKPAQEA